MASAIDTPFFVREKEFIKVFSSDFSTSDAVEDLASQEPLYSLPTPKAALWSPTGRLLAVANHNGEDGVQIVDFQDQAAPVLYDVPGSSKITQTLLWSPDSKFLVAVSPAQKGSSEPNVLVYSVDLEGGISLSTSFTYPKMERDKKIFQWSPDGSFCARLCQDGAVHIIKGGDPGGEELKEMALSHAVQNFEFAPVTEMDEAQGSKAARLAIFVPDVRDDMQRVVGPAEVTIWDITTQDSGLNTRRKAVASVASGQLADMQWNHTGTALLAHCTTEVDETGASYYGGSKLLLMSSDGAYQNDLTEAEETGSSVQAVTWSPARDEFILIMGFQPAKATLWSWDAEAQKPSIPKVLLEKAHRNTIRFNHFGSLVCLAGFGNLAGDVDFFGRRPNEKCDFVRIASCQANSSVSAEWSPDGRHFMTAVLAPRMRVDNGIGVWRALTGTRVSQVMFEELFDAQWRPEAQGSARFLDVPGEDIEQAAKDIASRENGSGGAPKKQAYRPPRARGEGGGSVAAMMRGEMAPDPADDRRRRPREPPQRAPQRHAEDNEQETEEPPQWKSGKPPEEGSREKKSSDHAVPEGQDSRREDKAASRRQPEQPVPVAPVPKAQHEQNGYPNAKAPAAQSQTAPSTQPRKAAAEPWKPSNPAIISSGLREPQAASQQQTHGQKLPCPETNWQYVDPKNNIQGPFTLLEMQQWHSMGYFRPQLRMRCNPSDKFIAFSDLFPHPLIPFHSYPKRPT
jgi:translation initiation factor 2A